MKNIFFLISLLSSSLIYGQSNLKISGSIQNKSNPEDKSVVDVYLFDTKNNLVKSMLSQGGRFEFDQLIKGTYYLQIVSDEWVQTESPFVLEESKNFTIIYNPRTYTLQEVSVVGKKNNFIIENGNITIDLVSSALNTLPTSIELLSKLPFVKLDANGEGLSFVGKGTPLLYIDNQRVDFSTFTGVSVEDIKSVEVIRNPSVKYESEGRAVIKINLKKSRKEGSQLTLTETAMFRKRFSNYLTANFQQRKNRIEWKLNAAYNQINHWESNGFNYSVPMENISSNYIIKSITKRPQTIFGGSIYQEINENDYLTFSVNANFRPDKGDNNTITDYSQNEVSDFIKTLTQANGNRTTINSIFNYNKKIPGINANIFTGFQFKRESKDVDYNFFNNYNDSGYEFNQLRVQSYGGNVYSGRIDAEKKLGENYLLEVGGSLTSAETKISNITDYQHHQSVELFKFNFKESNVASYLNIGVNAKKWQFKGGARLETTNAKGYDEIENLTKIKRHFIDWFPNAEVSFNKSDQNTYTINFRKSITRPNYSDLSSGGLYGSPYIEYVGNPYIIPTYTNTLSFSAGFEKWSMNASVYSARNPMGYTLVYDENLNISKFTMVNFDKELGANLGVDFSFRGKKWQSQNSTSINYDKIEDPLAVMKNSTPYLYVSSNNSYGLWKYLTFLLDGSFITKRIEGLYENNAICLINLGLTSTISDFDFTIRYNDLFRQMDYVQKMTYRQVASTGTFYGNTPTVSFAVKYNFGKLNSSKYKENTVNETSSRL